MAEKTLPQLKKDIDDLSQKAKNPQGANVEEREKNRDESVAQALSLSAQMQQMLSKAEYGLMTGFGSGIAQAGIMAAAEKLTQASMSIPGASMAGSQVGQMMKGYRERQQARREGGSGGISPGSGGGVGRYSGGDDISSRGDYSGGGGGAGGGTGIIDRSRFKAELTANPELRRKVMAIAGNENNNPQAQQAVIESMMNRASMAGTSLAAQAKWVTEGGYYDDKHGGHGRGDRLAANARQNGLESRLNSVLGGSNISNYATGNASGTFVQRRIAQGMFPGGVRFKAGGETFVGEDRGKGWKQWYKSAYKAPVAGQPSAGGGDQRLPQPGTYSGKIVSPVTGAYGEWKSNQYGAGRSGGHREHSGVDWHAANGSKVVSMTDGEVIFRGNNQGYDHNIVIKGDDGIIRRYATHGPTENLKNGTRVKAGQEIGIIARGHLHYEEIPPTLGGGRNRVYDEFLNNARTNSFTSTSNQRGTRHPPDIQYGAKVKAGEPLFAGRETGREQAAPGAGGTQPSVGQTRTRGGGVSEQTLAFIREREHFSPKAYNDGAQTSIGYGTKAKPGEKTITKAEGEKRLREEVSKSNDWVNQHIRVPITENQRSALTSFHFNLGGAGKENLINQINAGKWDDAYATMGKYNKVSGKYTEGIQRRRNLEIELAKRPGPMSKGETFAEEGDTGRLKKPPQETGPAGAEPRKIWPGETPYKGPQQGLGVAPQAGQAPQAAERVASEQTFGGPETSTVSTRMRDAMGAQSRGSGFSIGGGYYMTAAHTLSRASAVSVISGRESAQAEVIRKNTALDYAILKTSEEGTSRLQQAGMTNIGLSPETPKEGTRLTLQGYSGPTGRYTRASGPYAGPEDFSMKYDDKISDVPGAMRISTEESMGYLKQRMPGTSGGPVTDESQAAVGLVSGHGARGTEAAMFSPQMSKILKDIPEGTIPQSVLDAAIVRQRQIQAAAPAAAPATGPGVQGPFGGPQAAPQAPQAVQEGARKQWPGELPSATEKARQAQPLTGQPSQKQADGSPAPQAERAREQARGSRMHIPGKDLSGVSPELRGRLEAAYRAAPASAKAGFMVLSGRRSTELQAKLYQRFKSGKGGIAAPPGHSQHEHGMAVDIRDPSGWFHQHGKEFGIYAPMGKRDWPHFQMDPSWRGKSMAGQAPQGEPTKEGEGTGYQRRAHELKKGALREKAAQSPGHHPAKAQEPHKAPAKPPISSHHHPHQPIRHGNWASTHHASPAASGHSHVLSSYKKRGERLNHKLGDTA